MSETSETGHVYGCVFCVTGKEVNAARLIEWACEGIRVTVARQLMQKTVHGITHAEEKALYPGYAFFEAPAGKDIVRKFPKDKSILSVLKSETGDWRLYGNDAKHAQWLFSYDGLIPVSKACKEGEWVRIISGPLLSLQGQILHFDKHHRSAQVAISFCNRVIKTWFQYELIEPV